MCVCVCVVTPVDTPMELNLKDYGPIAKQAGEKEIVRKAAAVTADDTIVQSIINMGFSRNAGIRAVCV